MTKKDISRGLKNGSLKNRLVLFFDNKARIVYGKDRVLSIKEEDALFESFKKPNEVKRWNKWLKHSKTINVAIINLQNTLFEVKMNYNNLRGYILVWNTVEHSELLANSILHEIKDTTERLKVAMKGSKGRELIFTQTNIDKEGYLDLKIDFKKETYLGLKKGEEPRITNEFCLKLLLDAVKRETNKSIIKFISWRKAILDYIEEKEFNIKTYKDIIDTLTEDLHTPVIGWVKYLSKEETFFRSKNPQLDELKKKYDSTPIIDDLNIDIEEYNYFKKEFLSDE